jgi:Mrp family chromosome partitioning ATPase
MDRLEQALEKARTQRRFRAPRAATVPTLPAAETAVWDDAHLEANRIIGHRLRSTEADRLRLLRAQILQTMAERNGKTLAITSPDYGDGKTTLAINLALSIALDHKQTVLLADLDLRKPCIASYLGLDAQAGLTEHLLDGVPLADVLVRMPSPRLTVLPAGRAFDNSSEIIGSPRMATLANELKTRYPDRLVIYDMPPLLTQDDPLAFGPNIDAVLMVVREGTTRLEDLERSLSMLEDRPVLGIVLNDALPNGFLGLRRLLSLIRFQR